MQIILTLLTVFYLGSSFRHIYSRSNWFIATILLLFFLTSTYEITYLNFILSPNLQNLQFNWLENIRLNWLSGNFTTLFLSGLLFLISKISLYKLSTPLLIELIILSSATITILIKFLAPIFYLPIIITIFLGITIQALKNGTLIKFFTNNISKIKNITLTNLKNNFRILIAFIYLIFSLLTNGNSEELFLMSIDHIYRVIIIFLVLIIGMFLKGIYSTKLLSGIIPVCLIYLGLTSSSLMNFVIGNENISNTLSLNCLTSIALFPLIEIILNRYHLISPLVNNVSILRIQRKLFINIVNLIMIFITMTYLLYLLTQ